MIDIFNPPVSAVEKGLEGKLILIYGTNRTGKTLNAVKAHKPYVVGFERGLNAIPGIPYGPISTWRDWTDTVKQLTGPKMAQAKEIYNTIIIDTADAMGDLAAEAVCATFGAHTIGSGNKGYGLWKEYASEINKWLRLLVNAGYTVIFIAHEGEREFLDDRGEKYSKIYPRGEKRVIDPICDLCDFICYAQVQPNNAKGEAVNSTLYLSGTRDYHAGSRFPVVPVIPEWSMEKLEQAISDSIALKEKETGVQSASYAEKKQNEAEKIVTSKWSTKNMTELIEICMNKAQKMLDQYGGDPAQYQQLLFEELGNSDFKVSKATEKQRSQIEQVLDALEARGY